MKFCAIIFSIVTVFVLMGGAVVMQPLNETHVSCAHNEPLTKLEWMSGQVASGALSSTIYNTILSGQGNHLTYDDAAGIQKYSTEKIVDKAQAILDECAKRSK